MLVNQGRVTQQFLLLHLRQGFQFHPALSGISASPALYSAPQCQLLFLLLQQPEKTVFRFFRL
ncbi:hypothetical protein C6086_23380 [Escherichia coli]|nr:hypothetical protein C6086_23380 [Escherichia coli]